MNKLLMIHAMESTENIDSISPIAPDELPEIEKSFKSTVRVDGEVETHLVHLESLEDIIADVKDVVEQQKINLSEIKEENNLQEEKPEEPQQQEGSSSDSSGEGGMESSEGSDPASDGGDPIESDGTEGTTGGEGSSSGEGENLDDGGSNPEESSVNNDDVSDGSVEEEQPQDNPTDDDQPKDEGGSDEGGEGQEENKSEGEEKPEESDGGEEKKDEKDEEEDDEKPEPDLDESSTDEDVEKQVSQESLVLSNIMGRAGMFLNIKSKPTTLNLYDSLGAKKVQTNMESYYGKKLSKYDLYKTHHEGFLEVLSNFTEAAKDGISTLIKKVIEFFKKLLSNINNVGKTAKEESRIIGKIIEEGLVTTTNGSKIPLKDIKLDLNTDILDSGIDVNLLLGVDLMNLMSNEEALTRCIIDGTNATSPKGYIKDGQWAQYIIGLLMNEGLKKLQYRDDIPIDVYFLGRSCGYGFRKDKFGGLHIQEVYPEFNGKQDLLPDLNGQYVLDSVEHALLCLPVLNNPNHKKIIEDGLKFMGMLINEDGHLQTSGEIVKVLRAAQSRQLTTITSGRKLRQLVLMKAEEISKQEER